MSNLKNKLQKIAKGNERQITDKLRLIIEELILEKASEIGWTEGTSGVDELVEMNMEVDGGLDVETIASVICDAVEKWRNDTATGLSE